jgi:predicted  nucleic acid-binding Zn-ribbon protein
MHQYKGPKAQRFRKKVTENADAAIDWVCLMSNAMSRSALAFLIKASQATNVKFTYLKRTPPPKTAAEYLGVPASHMNRRWRNPEISRQAKDVYVAFDKAWSVSATQRQTVTRLTEMTHELAAEHITVAADLADVQIQLSTAQAQTARLSRELTEANQHLSAQRAALEDLTSKLTGPTQHNCSLLVRPGNPTANNDEGDDDQAQTVADQPTAIDADHQTVASCETLASQLKESISNLSAVLAKKTAEMEDLQAEATLLETDIGSLTTRKADLELSIGETERELIQRQVESESSDERVLELTRQVVTFWEVAQADLWPCGALPPRKHEHGHRSSEIEESGPIDARTEEEAAKSKADLEAKDATNGNGSGGSAAH